MTIVSPLRPASCSPRPPCERAGTGRVVAIRVQPDNMPPGVDHGSTIDLYLTTGGDAGGGQGGTTELIGRDLTVQSVTAPASGGLSGATSNRYQLSVLLPAEDRGQAGPDPADRRTDRRPGERAGREHRPADRGQRSGLGERAGRRAGSTRVVDDGGPPVRRHRRRAGHCRPPARPPSRSCRPTCAGWTPKRSAGCGPPGSPSSACIRRPTSGRGPGSSGSGSRPGAR